jgi:hypothetical protein
MKILFILLLFSINILSSTPIPSYFNDEESVNIEFRYDDYNFNKIKDGDSLKEISIVYGLNFDYLNVNFGFSKALNPEYDSSEESSKEIYHLYSSLGIFLNKSQHFNILIRLNSDFNTLIEANFSNDIGIGGVMFRINDFSEIRYSLFFEFKYNETINKVIKATLQLPLYYFNLGFSYNYNLESPQRDYLIFININDILEKHF